MIYSFLFFFSIPSFSRFLFLLFVMIDRYFFQSYSKCDYYWFIIRTYIFTIYVLWLLLCYFCVRSVWFLTIRSSLSWWDFYFAKHHLLWKMCRLQNISFCRNLFARYERGIIRLMFFLVHFEPSCYNGNNTSVFEITGILWSSLCESSSISEIQFKKFILRKNREK